ncbi:unnamed protein product, partial [Rotaria sp. Silwood1]
YIRPVILLGNDSSKILFRNAVRYLSADGSLEHTFQFNFSNESGKNSGVGQGIGFMDVKSIPNDPQKRAYSCGTNDNILYLIGSGITESLAVFDVSEVNNYTLDSVSILDSDTNETTTFREYCVNNSNIRGSHVYLHPNGENRFIVMNYFLKAGLAQFAGTRSVHVFKLNEQLTNFTYESRFNPIFNLIIHHNNNNT